MAEHSTSDSPNEPVPPPQPPAVSDYPTSGPWAAPTTSGAVWGAPPPQQAAQQAPLAEGARPRVATWKKVAGGVVLAAVIGGAGVAAVTAANASSGSATVAAGSSGRTVDGSGAQGFAGGQGSGGQGLGGAGMTPPGGGSAGGFGAVRELAGALHGEFVTTTDDRATQTMRMQNGTVSAAASGSLTVDSTDGFTATYVLPESLDVSAITVGDQVLVVATVNGDTVTATAVQSASTTGGGMPGGMRPGSGSDSAPSVAPTRRAPQTS